MWAVVGTYPKSTDVTLLLPGAKTPPPSAAYLVTYKTTRLRTHLSQIKELAGTSETVLATIRYLDEVVSLMDSEWRGALLSFNTFFEKFSKKLNQLGGMFSL